MGGWWSFALILFTIAIAGCIPAGCGMDTFACGVLTEEEFQLLVEHKELD